MYQIFRSLYRGFDKAVFRHLPLKTQLVLKGWALSIVHLFFPSRVLAKNAFELVDFSSVKISGRQPQQAPGAANLPEWVREELVELSEIDPAMHPDGAWMSRVVDDPGYALGVVGHASAGKVYRQLRLTLKGPIDVVIAVPWLKTGGADLGAIHVANVLADQHGQRVVVITTEAAISPWAGRLSKRVQFLDAGAVMAQLAPPHRVEVIVRLMLQCQPRVIHVMNSRLFWDAIARNGLALKQFSRLYASLYCDDFTKDGLPVGYAREYLPRCYTSLQAVLTDNSQTWKRWVRAMGMPHSLFHVLRFPAPMPVVRTSDTAPRTLLWAGRLDRQKRPDLVAEIARKLPEFQFDVYGSAVLEPGEIQPLRRLDNVRMRGEFSRFGDLVKPEHLALLYTTDWDGMPNVLLEAAAAGLPIIAPNVGGISDLLPEDELVESSSDVDGFVRQIRELAQDSKLRSARTEALRARIVKHRSQESFVQSVREIPSYFEAVAGSQPEPTARATARL